MNKTLIGIIFISTGLAYGSLAIDNFYGKTLGWLVENKWIKEPEEPQKNDIRMLFGKKPAILLYSLGLIIIGTFILWNQ
jgi:hypothetical protein